MTKSCFVDTSVWVEYFRGTVSALTNLVEELIKENRVSVNGIIIAELMIGARTEKEKEFLSFYMDGLHVLELKRSVFIGAGGHGFFLKKKGISVPFSDLLIATQCIENNLMLIDNDRHFDAIAKHLPLKRHKKG
jgi:predicted nucleic acid-binding protein